MIDDEFTNLIRERQRRAECEAAGVIYVPDVLATRSTPHCDPEVTPVPDQLLEPNAAPALEVAERVLPLPLLIQSPEVTVICADNGGGTGAAISPLGESSIELYLDDIEAITRSELYLVAGKQVQLQAAVNDNLELLAAVMLAGSASAVAIAEANFDAAIVAASGLEPAAAAGIRGKALELRGNGGGASGAATGLYAIAELTAMSRLICLFDSQPLWAVCDSTTQTGFSLQLQEPSPLTPPNRYRHREAAFRTSTISVADANDLAALDAVADPTFECVYVSQAVTVTCAEDVGLEFDHPYQPEFSWNGSNFGTLAALGESGRLDVDGYAPVTSGFTSYSLDSLSRPRTLVTTVSAVAGLYPAVTQAEANEKAREAAVRFLNCFFPSREGVVDCANRDADPESNPVMAGINALAAVHGELDFEELRDMVFAEMDSEFIDVEEAAIPHLKVTNLGIIPRSPGPGADTDDSEGLRVVIPAGMVVSLFSAEAAEAEARDYALGRLSCFWVAPAVTCSCVAEDQTNPAENSYFFNQAQLDVYLAEYNSAASSGVLSFAKGELGSSEDSAIPVSDTMALCKAALACVYCNQTVPPRCSVAYTDGFAYDLWSPQTDAGLPIALTSTAGTSSGISAGLPAGVVCDANPALVNTLAVSTGSLPPLVNEAQGNPRCRYGNREISKTCAEKVGSHAYALTPESAGRNITVSAGSFEAETQTEADGLAASFINAALICEYGSPPMFVLCGATSAVDTISADEYVTTRTYGTGLGVALAATGGSATPLSAAAHTFTSLESPENAKAQALLSLVTQLDCFWQSAQIDLACGASPQLPVEQQAYGEAGAIRNGDLSKKYADDSHGSAYGEVTLPSKSVTSYASQPEANRIAYAIAFDELDCFWQSARIDLLCGAPSACPVDSLESGESATIQSGTNDKGYCPDSTGDLIGEVFMPAKAVVSYVSQADANSQAYALTYPQLDCFWQSARIDLLCGAPSVCPVDSLEFGESATIQSGTNERRYCPDSTGNALGEVFTAAKAVVSYVSQADANTQAYALTYPQLDCFWQSARIELMCEAPVLFADDTPEDGTISKGRAQTAAFSKKFCPDSIGDTPGEVFTAAKAVTSYVSQADANAQAYALTYPQLDCFWQSAKIDLRCGAPVACPAALRGNRESSPIQAGSNDKNCCPDSTGDLIGEVFMPAKAVVSYVSQADANSQAYALTYPQLDCFWQSARIDLLCGAPLSLPASSATTPENGTIVAGDNKQLPPKEPYGESRFCPDSIGDVLGEVFTEAKTVVSYVSQADANSQAYALTYPQLDCFFQSPQIIVWCTPVVYLPDHLRSSSNQDWTVWSGSGAEKNSVVLPAKTEVSYRSQAEATVKAYEAAKKELSCISAKHAFSLISRPSGGVYSKCCTKLDPDVIKEGGSATKLYSPDPQADLLSPHPGYTVLPLTGQDVQACDEYPVWFYLEAEVSFHEGELWARYRATTSAIVTHRSEQNLVEGVEGDYKKVRRLIAKVEQETSSSSFGAEERATCGGINFMQLVTTEQKISTSQMGDKHIPFITDFSTPEGGGGGAVAEQGAFVGRWTATTGVNAGNIYLQGGTVSGKEVLTSALQIYDPDATAPWGVPNDHLLLSVTGSAVVVDGVIMPGFNVSKVDVSRGPWVADTYPTRTAAGVCKISLGTFTTNGFLAAGPAGHKTVGWCPGGAYNY